MLWESVRDDPEQVKAREAVIATTTEIIQQVELWQQAAAMRRDRAPSVANTVDAAEEATAAPMPVDS